MDQTLSQPARAPSTPLASLTAVYLLIPVVFFAWGWLQWPYALATTLLVVAFMFFALRDAWRERPSRAEVFQGLSSLWPALLVVSVWTFFSGIGGFGFQNPDYNSNNALFKGLIDGDWPLQIEFAGQTVYVVYYFAYFLPAAGVGKLLGWGAANLALFAWALTGVLLAFAWFRLVSGLRPGPWARLLLALVFCLAGGLDVIGYYVFNAHPFLWGKHIENWGGLFQFSSQATLLYWVPQQALAAWLLAGLTFATAGDTRLIRSLAMSVAAGTLWSPFGVVGVVPYLLGLAILLLVRKQGKSLFVSPTVEWIIAAAWVATVSLLFISSNEYEFPIGLLWNLAKSRQQYLVTGIVFWCLEFGLLAIVVVVLGAFIRRSRKQTGQPGSQTGLRRTWFGLAILTLSGLLLFKMGFNNDLAMRASIASLFFLWAFVSRILVEAGPCLRQRRVKIAHAAAVCLLLIGSYTGLSEVIRSAKHYHFGPPDPAGVREIATASYTHIVAQRIGQEEAPFFRLLAP
ncbi:MAG: hypothetical protein JXB85_15905 [Anaerolineales bacterium]|nr:hypothetical protein [Anaerolineales bacterium]